jgi:hypothetical protein
MSLEHSAAHPIAYAAAVSAERGESEEVDVLSIGSVVGGVGPAARAWDAPINELTSRVAQARLGITSPLSLNVVFHVPGEVLRPSNEYARAGRYDSETCHLMVQATVPQSLPEQPDRFLVARLSEAVDAAEEWARRRGLADSLPALRTVLARLA